MAKTPLRRIVVCVDDVGLHEGVNRAAIELARAGRVSALSVLVGAPASAAAAEALRAPALRGVDIGLHLDLCEYPLRPELRSRPRSLTGWVLRSAFAGIDRALVRAELAAQVATFTAQVGRPPDFIDGHRHVHQLPGVREVLVEWWLALPAGARPWMRRSRPRAPAASPKAWLMDRLGGRGLQALAAAAGVRQNTRLLGVYDFRGGAGRYAALAARWLHAAREGDLLMCHPSDPLAPALAAGDPLHEARCAEGAFWASPQAAELMLREGVAVRRLRETAAA